MLVSVFVSLAFGALLGALSVRLAGALTRPVASRKRSRRSPPRPDPGTSRLAGRHDASDDELRTTRLDEIDEVSDGRCPYRPVRHHFGISSFAVNARTARAAGDRLINEHDESEPDSDEELGGGGGSGGWGGGGGGNGGSLYNVACCESLAGRPADAIDHLALAIDRSERFRSYAEEESDFDPIRDEPGFKELLRR